MLRALSIRGATSAPHNSATRPTSVPLTENTASPARSPARMGARRAPFSSTSSYRVSPAARGQAKLSAATSGTVAFMPFSTSARWIVWPREAPSWAG